MKHPLVTHPDDSVALLPPQLFGSVVYYSVMAAYPNAVIDTSMRFDKRLKSAHRYAIADTRGRLELTVPVSHPAQGCPRNWQHTLISPHGRWWDVHRVALESAYGRTPFFEFYIDRLLPIFAEPSGESVASQVIAADKTIREILGLATNILAPDAVTDELKITDYRNVDFTADNCPRKYWQVRGDSLGFIDRLSILDLIFNLGPEAPLYLRPAENSTENERR